MTMTKYYLYRYLIEHLNEQMLNDQVQNSMLALLCGNYMQAKIKCTLLRFNFWLH